MDSCVSDMSGKQPFHSILDEVECVFIYIIRLFQSHMHCERAHISFKYKLSQVTLLCTVRSWLEWH
jgi:hypothetical protein